MSGVRSLAELADCFSRSRDKEGRIDVTCGYCGAKAERVAWDTARGWFVEHRCIGQTQQPELDSRTLAELLRLHNLAALLTQRPSGGSWREMNAMTVYRGGRRIGLEPATAEQLKHAERVDRILTRILGGVPQPRAPRATVLVFPDRHSEELEAAA